MSTSSSAATTQTVYIAIPSGGRVRGARVKKFLDMPNADYSPHPGKRHSWFHMDHYGTYGTGFAMCVCGAMGAVSPRKVAA